MNRANERVDSAEERLSKLEGVFDIITQNMARRWKVRQTRRGE